MYKKKKRRTVTIKLKTNGKLIMKKTLTLIFLIGLSSQVAYGMDVSKEHVGYGPLGVTRIEAIQALILGIPAELIKESRIAKWIKEQVSRLHREASSQSD